MNMSNVFASLDIMWKGMLGLFVVCGFVALLTMLIKRIAGKKEA
ncbi:hypothetical protein FACS1894141_4710 [Spirochaetia bacterium]|nr:hypothetical protein FACS1894141_4710 [Spirochaetia bacterium]